MSANHHLWRNGRLWWIAFTIHRGPFKERIRRSLETSDLEEARRRRDAMLARFATLADVRLAVRASRRRAA